jgi:eukaryotic-like serine/threonine-protein kinase
VTCPDPSALDAFASGALREPARDALVSHLDTCADCASVVAELMRVYGSSAAAQAHEPARVAALVSLADPHARTLAAPSDDGARALALPATIGRHRVLAPLGEGGMGRVVAAHDPHLDRPVALKLLHDDPSVDPEERRLRLAREARAMAKLSHPNVVTVFDVGFDEATRQLFVAMELVPGTTLTRALAERRRSRDEVLSLFLAAGEGLSAAHAAGLVHRDFKPDNVLVGRDGRVRVTDFGLARPPRARGHEGVDAIHLTRVGAIVGTPAYMAPEQFEGKEADPRTDQFAFAVALFEALEGTRPFAGNTLGELRDAVLAGKLVRAPSGPRRIARALTRALSVDPNARFPSMAELLRELQAPVRRLRSIALGATFVVGLASALVGATWFVASRGPSSPDPIAALVKRADPTEDLDPPSDATHEAVAELREELRELEAQIARHPLDYGPLHARSVRAVATARDLDYAPALAESLVTRARLDRLLGRPRRVEVALEEVVRLARAARYDALLFEATVSLAEVVGVDQGRAKDAAPWLDFAEAEARRSKDEPSLARLALTRGRVLARAGRAEEARAALTTALEAAERAHGADSLEPAEVLRERAEVLRALSDPARAVLDAGRAWALAEQRLVIRDGEEAARFLATLGAAQLDAGALDDAAATLDQASRAAESYGTTSGIALTIRDAEARLAHLRGDAGTARAKGERALAGLLLESETGALTFFDPTGSERSAFAIDFASRVKSKVEKPDDSSAIRDQNARAARTATEGDEAGAARIFAEALSRAEENPSLDASSTGAIQHNRALLALRRGDLAEAKEEIGAARTAMIREVGEDHLRHAVCLALEARILDKLGSPSAAETKRRAQALSASRGWSR